MKLPVLKTGYVRLVDSMGTDLTSVNAAKASFMKASKGLGDKEVSLLNFLIRNSELSPFRHATLQWEIKAPIQTCRQWWKYAVGSQHGEHLLAWNEASRRYLTTKIEFYVPSQFKFAPENKKQGSGEAFPIDLNNKWHSKFVNLYDELFELYEQAIEEGMCAEQARGLLPGYNVMTVWQWTSSLQATLFFLKERLGAGAQEEIRDYAKAVYKLTYQRFPKTIELLLSEHLDVTKEISL